MDKKEKMKALKSLLVAGIGVAALAVPLAASATVITFEGFPDLTVLTNQDFGNGVTFAGATVLSAGGSLNSGNFPPHSGINVVYNPSGPMQLNFTTASDFFSGYFTYNQQLTVTAYDSANQQVDQVISACAANYVGSGCGAANEFLEVTDPGNIAYVVITGGGGNNFTLDDASFTGSRDPGLPEPATLVMLLGGLGSLALSRRRKTVA